MACPILKNLTTTSQCVESFGGLTSKIHFAERQYCTFTANTSETDPESVLYSSISVANGKLIEINCQMEKNKATGKSNGATKGFTSSLNSLVDRLNPETSSLLRAVNNLDLVVFAEDEPGLWIVFYDKYGKLKIDDLSADTGATSTDDRTTVINVSNVHALYPIEYALAVTEEAAAGG